MPADDLRAEALARYDTIRCQFLGGDDPMAELIAAADALRARLAELSGKGEPCELTETCILFAGHDGGCEDPPSVGPPGIPALAAVMGLPATVPMTNADHTTPNAPAPAPSEAEYACPACGRPDGKESRVAPLVTDEEVARELDISGVWASDVALRYEDKWRVALVRAVAAARERCEARAHKEGT